MGVIALGKDALGVGTLGARGSGPWWDPHGEGLCVYQAQQPKGAVSFLASLTDVSGNGNPAGDPGGLATPAWDAVNGWKPDGIQTYLTTTFLPQTDQSQAALVQFTNHVHTLNTFLFGATNAAGAGTTFGILPSRTNDHVRYRNGADTDVLPVLLAGNLAIAGDQGYRNGAGEGVPIGVWTGPSVHSVYIAARNNIGVPEMFTQCYIQAFALYDCTLTAPQVWAVRTRMAAL